METGKLPVCQNVITVSIVESREYLRLAATLFPASPHCTRLRICHVFSLDNRDLVMRLTEFVAEKCYENGGEKTGDHARLPTMYGLSFSENFDAKCDMLLMHPAYMSLCHWNAILTLSGTVLHNP